MATRTTQYQITGDASRFASAMDEASKATEQMEGSLSALRSNIETATQGTLEFDDAVNRYRDSAGRFVSAADAQEAAMSALREEGVRTEDQIQEQIQRLEALREVKGDDAVATQELTERISSLRGELQQAEAAVRQSEQAARNLQQGFGSGVEATTDFAQRQDMLQQELLSTAAAQERVASSGVTMRSSVGASANNLAFEMTQAAQDAQFGLAGVANQIPLMSEQFTQLQAKAGSTGGAISALAKTFLGPTGLLAAGTLLIQMGPEITGWLTGTEKQLRAVGSEGENAADAIDSFVESASDLQEIPNQLTQVLTRIREVQAASATDILLGVSQGEIRRGARLAGAPRGTTRERGLEILRGNLRGTTVEARTLRNALEAAGVSIEEVLQGSVSEATEEIQENRKAFQNWEQVLREFSGTPGAIVQESLEQFSRLQEGQQSLTDAGIIGQEEALQRQVSFLESQIEAIQTESPFDIGQEQFQPLLSFYRSLQARLEDLEEQGEETKEAMKPPEVDFVTDRRLERLRSLNEVFQETMLLRQQASRAALRGLPAAGQGPALEGAGGGMFDQLASQLGRALNAQGLGFDKIGRQIGKKMLKSARQALIRGEITEDEFEAFKDAFEAAGFTVENDINFGLEQSIRLASQLGTTMIQAAQQGGVAWNQLLGSILTTIGSVVGQANPVAGAALAGSGQILGAIDTGGSNDRRAAASQAQASRAARSTTAGVESQLAETNARLGRVEAAIATREVAVPVRETKHAIVEDDIAEGQSTGNPLVANVENL